MLILKTKDLAKLILKTKGLEKVILKTNELQVQGAGHRFRGAGVPTQAKRGLEWATGIIAQKNILILKTKDLANVDPDNKGLSKVYPENKGLKTEIPQQNLKEAQFFGCASLRKLSYFYSTNSPEIIGADERLSFVGDRRSEGLTMLWEALNQRFRFE